MSKTRLPHVPRAVIFDMDGLLVDTERLAMRALAETARELAIDAPDDFCRSMIGVPADACLALVKERFGPAFGADSFLKQSSARMDTFIARGLLIAKPGAADLLDALEDMRLPRAIATSSSRTKADAHLRAAGLHDRFDIVVTRDDVHRGKPHPDVFLEAARRLGFDPPACLALEDSHNGVRAAHAANIAVIMVPDLLHPTPETSAICAAEARDLHVVRTILQDTFLHASDRRQTTRSSARDCGHTT